MVGMPIRAARVRVRVDDMVKEAVVYGNWRGEVEGGVGLGSPPTLPLPLLLPLGLLKVTAAAGGVAHAHMKG